MICCGEILKLELKLRYVAQRGLGIMTVLGLLALSVTDSGGMRPVLLALLLIAIVLLVIAGIIAVVMLLRSSYPSFEGYFTPGSSPSGGMVGERKRKTHVIQITLEPLESESQ